MRSAQAAVSSMPPVIVPVLSDMFTVGATMRAITIRRWDTRRPDTSADSVASPP